MNDNDLIYRRDVFQELDSFLAEMEEKMLSFLEQYGACANRAVTNCEKLVTGGVDNIRKRINAIPAVEKNILSPRSCAIIMAYTGVAMLRGEKLRHFYSYLAELYGRPIFTHELSYLNDLADRAKADFLALCAEVNDESD